MLCCELVAIYDNANLLKLSPNCKFSVAKYISVFLLQLWRKYDKVSDCFRQSMYRDFGIAPCSK